MAVSTIDPNGLNIGQIGGRRRLNLNGAFTIAQRAISATSVASNGFHTVDRWSYNDDSNGVLTMSQDTNAPDGFAYSFKSLVTTSATHASNAQSRVETTFEGQDLQQLKYGTSDAQQVTVSFWVKTNKAGNWSVGLYMDGSGYNISQVYTVNSADTWEYKTVTFAANTVQSITNDNTKRLRLWYTLAAGVDRTSGTSNTWSTSATNRAVGQAVDLYDATNNYWQITGVQLEVGDVATPFEHRPYGEELSACQRYYFNTYSQASNMVGTPGIVADNGANKAYRVAYQFPVHMRTAPSATFIGTMKVWDGTTVVNYTSAQTIYTDDQRWEVDANLSADLIDGRPAHFYQLTSGDYMAFDAEL